MASSEFVMGTLAGQQRPRPPYPPALKSVAIRSLAVTVMVVAPPKRAEGCVDLQDSVDDPQRVLHGRVVGTTDSIANQFEETGVHDLFGRELHRSAGRLVCQHKGAAVRVLVHTLINVAGVDADVVTGDPGYECPLRRDRPAFDMRFEEIGIIADELGRDLVAAVSQKLGCAYQCSDVGRQR